MSQATPQSLSVLHLTAGAVLGGVTRHICDLSKELIGRGHRSIAGGSPGPWGNLSIEEGVPWIDLPLDGGARSLWKAAGEIARIVEEQRINILHCHFRRPLLAGRMARLRGMPHIPLVYTLHLAPVPISGIQHKLAGFGDLVIAPAEEGRRWIIGTGRVKPERVVLVPHGIHLEKWTVPDDAVRVAARNALAFGDVEAIVAFVGRFEYPKNEQWVLDAAVACRKRGMKVGFVLCGDGPNLPQVKDRIDRENLGEIVRLCGYVDPLSIYHAADLVVLPSSIEGFAYVAAEAAACGVAVLRTKTAGWQETIREGVTGHVAAIEHDAFVDAAMAMLQDMAGLRAMGVAAAAFARAELAFGKQVDRTIDVYRDIVARFGAA